MNRAERLAGANAFASAVAYSQALHTDAENEVEQLRAALAQRDATIAAQAAELRDYEKTTAKLRADLRDEEARRAGYQAVHGAARRFVAAYREKNEPWTDEELTTAVDGSELPKVGGCPVAALRGLLAAVPRDGA